MAEPAPKHARLDSDTDNSEHNNENPKIPTTKTIESKDSVGKLAKENALLKAKSQIYPIQVHMWRQSN